jgi:hypothetical protein
MEGPLRWGPIVPERLNTAACVALGRSVNRPTFLPREPIDRIDPALRANNACFAMTVPLSDRFC